MKVYFVGAGPGDPELLTCKAARLLAQSRFCIYAGSLVDAEILQLLPEDAEHYDSAQLNLEEIAALFQNAKDRNLDVVRLHSGDPAIYGAIKEQMQALDTLGIGYEIIPGVSSFSAAAAALKTELTAPEIAQTVILTRAKGRTPVPEGQELKRLAASQATLCIFLSVQQIEEIARVLTPFYGADCPAAVVYHASRRDELVVKGTLANIALRTREEKIKKTAMIVVGRVLEKSDLASKLYDKTFAHEFREAKV